MSGEVRGILVMRLGTSVGEEIRNQFHTPVEKTCQALGIRHVIEDRRESEGWIRIICILSPAGFSRSVDAVQWAKETACRVAGHSPAREAATGRKYRGAWIDLEEKASAQEETGSQAEFGKDLEDGDEQEGEELF